MTIVNVGPTRRFTQISDAITWTNSGDTILIDEGVYEQKFYLRETHRNFIGNTKYPERGQVVIKQPSSNEYLFYLEYCHSKNFYFEGLRLAWSPGSEANEGYDFLFDVYDSDSTTITFNRCIIDASFYWKYVFQIGACTNTRVNMYNCRVNYAPDIYFNSSNPDQFVEQASYVMFDIKKCIFPYMLEHSYTSRPDFPNGLQHNVANTSNVTCDFSNVSNMFNMRSDQYASRGGCTVGQKYYIDVELDSPTLITKWLFGSYYQTDYDLSGYVNFQGSNNQIDWTNAQTSYVRPDSNANLYYETFNTLFTTAYKYYRLEIEAIYSTIRVSAFSMLAEGNDDIFFDYITPPTKPGYGPAYGNYLLDMPKQYYFDGTISDTILDDVIIDTVTWNPYDKSSKVSLSNGNLTATISTSNKYQDQAVRATVSRESGKWYWEFKSSSTYGECRVGVGTDDAYINSKMGYASYSWGYEYRTGKFYNNNSVILEGPASENDDIIGVAYDAYNGKLWFSKNGQWMFEGNPETGVNPTLEIQADLFPMASLKSSNDYAATVDLIINSSELNYDIPTGYSFYGTKIIWKVKAINANTNLVEGWDYSDPKDASYRVLTTYSGSHFLICEDAAEEPVYNDLILGRFEPEEWV